MDEFTTYRELIQMQEFESKVPENARNKLNDGERFLADTISIIDQREAWIADKLIVAYNLSIKHENFLLKYGNPLSVIILLLGLATTGFLGALIQHWIGK